MKITMTTNEDRFNADVISPKREWEDKAIHLIAIPEFIVNTLKAKKISLDDIKKSIRIDRSEDSILVLEENLTKRDFSMVVAAHDILIDTLNTNNSKLVTSPNFLGTNKIEKEERSKAVLDLIDILSNEEEINMSTGNVTTRSDFRLDVYENVVFVILKSGFTNYVVKNENSYKNVVAETVIEELFKYFPEQRVITHWVF